MNNEDSKFIINWGKVRKRGIVLYWLRNEFICIVGWFLGSILGLLIKEKKLPSFNFIISESFAVLMGFITAGFIGSFLWWFVNEKKYKELISKNENEM